MASIVAKRGREHIGQSERDEDKQADKYNKYDGNNNQHPEIYINDDDYEKSASKIWQKPFFSYSWKWKKYQIQ